MTETCVFCGSEGETFRPEHWIPQWLSRAVVGKRQMVEINEYGRDTPRYARAFELTVPRVCADCNHHWMSDMESRTRDLALPLIRGDEKTSLNTKEQWADPGLRVRCLHDRLHGGRRLVQAWHAAPLG